MITLLLDSSNKNLSVGIAKDKVLLASKEYDAWQQQSELMVPEIDALIRAQNLTPQNVNNIVVAIGPGSYTGVRIAVTIAKIMAFLLGAKLYTVSSLAVLAHETKPTICLANARSNRSYFAVYQNGVALEADTILSNEEVKNYINKHHEFAVTGDLEYLGLQGDEFNRFNNMLTFVNEKYEAVDLLPVKPVYLKD